MGIIEVITVVALFVVLIYCIRIAWLDLGFTAKVKPHPAEPDGCRYCGRPRTSSGDCAGCGGS